MNISCEQIAEDGQRATFRFTVSDTGIGISEEFFPNLFQPFAQEHVGSRSTYEGTGLGLSIVKKIVDKLGGEITVKSKLGEGSAFTFTLPFDIDPAPETIQSLKTKRKEAQDLKGVNLLLAEDNELNMEIAQFMLENAGASIKTVMNGQEAVNAFAASAPGTFDAILMDIMMPVMDGLKATEHIRALERPDAKTIPILAMTANAFAEDVEKCRRAGMNAHLAKPLDAADVIRVLNEQVHRKR